MSRAVPRKFKASTLYFIYLPYCDAPCGRAYIHSAWFIRICSACKAGNGRASPWGTVLYRSLFIWVDIQRILIMDVRYPFSAVLNCTLWNIREDPSIWLMWPPATAVEWVNHIICSSTVTYCQVEQILNAICLKEPMWYVLAQQFYNNCYHGGHFSTFESVFASVPVWTVR